MLPSSKPTEIVGCRPESQLCYFPFGDCSLLFVAQSSSFSFLVLCSQLWLVHSHGEAQDQPLRIVRFALVHRPRETRTSEKPTWLARSHPFRPKNHPCKVALGSACFRSTALGSTPHQDAASATSLVPSCSACQNSPLKSALLKSALLKSALLKSALLKSARWVLPFCHPADACAKPSAARGWEQR